MCVCVHWGNPTVMWLARLNSHDDNGRGPCEGKEPDEISCEETTAREKAERVYSFLIPADSTHYADCELDAFRCLSTALSSWRVVLHVRFLLLLLQRWEFASVGADGRAAVRCSRLVRMYVHISVYSWVRALEFTHTPPHPLLHWHIYSYSIPTPFTPSPSFLSLFVSLISFFLP